MMKDILLQHAEGVNRSTDTLIRISPGDKVSWNPGPTFMTAGQLLHHLSNCPAVISMAATNSFPSSEKLREYIAAELKKSADPSTAAKRLAENFAAARSHLTGLSDGDLVHRTVAMPFGGSVPLAASLLFAIQHQTNHTMQLFSYLKLLGLPVNTETLYSGKVPEGVRAV
jgi:uncharacterized damage-inducible protein DinB